MHEMPSSWLPLPAPRRWMSDLVQLARSTPTATVQRTMFLNRLATARQGAWPRPGWCALFLKAYSLLAARRPVLRQIYMPLPWPHLYEHPTNVATVAIARPDEDAVFFARLESPETLGLWAIEKRLQELRERPIAQVADFHRLAKWSRLPGPIRRLGWRLAKSLSGPLHAATLGTFGLSTLAGLGALHSQPLSLWTMALSYGPLARDGRTEVCLSYDPRVRDAPTVARALSDLEDVLLGEIVNELGYLRDLEAA
jgi:hypothetical protein